MWKLKRYLFALVVSTFLFCGCHKTEFSKSSKQFDAKRSSLDRDLDKLTTKLFNETGRPKHFFAIYSTSSWVHTDVAMVYFGNDDSLRLGYYYFKEYITMQYILKQRVDEAIKVDEGKFIIDKDTTLEYHHFPKEKTLKKCLPGRDENLIDDGGTLFFYDKNGLVYKTFMPLQNKNNTKCAEIESLMKPYLRFKREFEKVFLHVNP